MLTPPNLTGSIFGDNLTEEKCDRWPRDWSKTNIDKSSENKLLGFTAIVLNLDLVKFIKIQGSFHVGESLEKKLESMLFHSKNTHGFLPKYV